MLQRVLNLNKLTATKPMQNHTFFLLNLKLLLKYSQELHHNTHRVVNIDWTVRISSCYKSQSTFLSVNNSWSGLFNDWFRRDSWHIHGVQISQILVTCLRTQCHCPGPCAVNFLARYFANNPDQETSSFRHILYGSWSIATHIHTFHRGIFGRFQLLIAGTI